jgi:phosphatidylserine decarboxylase
MARDAFQFLIPLVVGGLIALWAGWTLGAALMIALAGFVAFFFRDPGRHVPQDPDVIVSPADGRIVRIERGDRLEISIFLSLFDVHINRAPIAGTVTEVDYRAGRFLAAFKDEASRLNERNSVTIEGPRLTTKCVQIAGVVARRIVCWKEPGDLVEKGERIGLIRFGSRVDLSLPLDIELEVRKGDRVKGGASRIGILRKGL